MADLHHTMNTPNTRGPVEPWQYGHPTFATIKADRPITAREGQWLLDELERLHTMERTVNSTAYNLNAAIKGCQDALEAMGRAG